MKEFRAKLVVKPAARPRFHRPRSVPYALNRAIENSKELDHLEETEVMLSGQPPVWRCRSQTAQCGDYKVTVNKELDIDLYPLPRLEDMMTSLTGGQKFSKLDLSAAYQQMPLNEECQKFVTINTHWGLYHYTRLPFGIASAPALFRKVMDTILQGIPHIICYLDDILVTGANDAEHLTNLIEVLSRLQRHGVHLKQKKCCCLQDLVDYLGHHVTADSFHIYTSKVEALRQAPPPPMCLSSIHY